ncbi:hypothetical protein AAG570_011054 [Ranatra chinensis]|uniref:Uncharacterized protein n=1 Tax=Ranatra chinensis TaxID=642074 RepID=A0ABD0YXW0_9HEMI
MYQGTSRIVRRVKDWRDWIFQNLDFWLRLLVLDLSPESVVIPIVSCILGFPLLALLVICCLRRRAKLARERDRRRAGDAFCLVIHGSAGVTPRASHAANGGHYGHVEEDHMGVEL